MKTKTTRRALLMSVLSLIICVSMLVGTTFAWFTDSVSSNGNIIQSGNLDIEMHWAEGTEDPASVTWKDASTDAIFDYDLWEPGYVSVRHIKISNEGSLALKYMVAIEANGEISELAEVIDVYYMDPAVQVTDRTDLKEENKLNTLDAVLGKMDSTAAGTLESGKEDVITIALKMQESAGNKYQNMSIGTDFSVKVFATQLTAEKDSFDDQYDAGAYLPVVNNVDELRGALSEGKSVRINGTMDADDVVLPFGENYPDHTGEYYYDQVPTVKGGNFIIDTGAKYGIVASPLNNGTSTYSDFTMDSTSQWSMYVSLEEGRKAIINNAEILARSGAGIYAPGAGEVVLNDVKVNHLALDPEYSATPWGATAVAVAVDADMTINSGTYVGSSYGVYIYSSGGKVTINGGTFKGQNVIAADACGTGVVAEVIIHDGNFDGAIQSLNVGGGGKSTIVINGGNFTNYKNSAGSRLTVKGGTFDSDPSANVAKDYKAVNNGDGTWTVVEKTYYEKENYTVKEAENVGDVSGALDFDKDVAVVLPAVETSTPVIALDYTGSSDKNFAIIGENTVFSGDLQVSSHSNFKLGDNAELVIDGITVNGTLKVVAYYKNIVIKNVKAKSITVNDGGNVTVENCTLDGAADNGLYVVATADNYNLTIKDNTITNSAKNAVQISGCASGATYGAGAVIVTGNTFENWCVKNDKPRAAFKVWGDSNLAPESISSADEMQPAATALVNGIESGNNTFISNNANQVQYDFYDWIF